MGWFYFSQIFELSLTPLVFENLSKIAKFLESRGIPVAE